MSGAVDNDNNNNDDNDDAATPPVGDISFFDNYIPSLVPGRYTIVVDHEVSGGTAVSPEEGLPVDKAQPPIEPTTFAVQQSFEVQGSRYGIVPAEVHSVSPPAQTHGIYELQLPQIVLTKRALPWEQPLRLDHASQQPSTIPDTVPWLALLVLTPDQIETRFVAPGVDPNKNPTRSGRQLLRDVIGRQTTDGTTIQGPQLCLSAWEDPDTITVTVIDMTPATFAALVPTLEEAPLLTHVRTVDTGDKTLLGMKNDGWFSVVISNRLPQHVGDTAGPTPYIAHLVSLEGFETFLDQPAADTSSIGYMRMLSLYSWTFGVDPEGASFAKLMGNLLTDTSNQGTDWLLKLPQSEAMAAARAEPGPTGLAARALDAGYAPLGYSTRPGDQTFAWYRGPLLPVGTTPFLDAAPPRTAGDALVYDDESGLFDVSYAVAFQTGRLVALSSKSFSLALLDWRRSLNRTVDVLLDRLASPHWRRLSGDDRPLGEMSGEDVAAIAAPRRPVQTLFLQQVMDRLVPLAPPAGLPAGSGAADPTASTPPVRDHAAEIALAMASPGVADHLQSEPPPAGVVDFLASLVLLAGVPFNNLVPDERMLPKESLRCFYIDSNWLHALVDGALSVGAHTSRDAAMTAMMRAPLLDVVGRVTGQVRAKRLGVAVADPDVPAAPGGSVDPTSSVRWPVAGVLLRSSAVGDYHALEVKAFADAAGIQQIDVLRLAELSPNVLLCLLSAVPERIDIDEPREGLCFGIELEDPDRIVPRYVTDGADPAQRIGMPHAESAAQQPTYKVAPGMKLIDVLRTAATLKAVVAQDGDFGPADFALNMVRVPEQMVWRRAGGRNG